MAVSLSSTRPEWAMDGLYANEDGLTVGGVLRQWLQTTGTQGQEIFLAAGYASFRGLHVLAPVMRVALDAGVPVRLLIGAEMQQRAALVRPVLEDDAQGVADGLRQAEDYLRAELDGLPTDASYVRFLNDLRQLLRHPLMQCRRLEQRFMHAKVFSVRMRDGSWETVMGSFNLTLPGLRTSAELGCAVSRQQSNHSAARANQWWELSAPYDMAGLIDERLCPYAPELVYLRMLRQRFGDQVNAAPSRLRLRPFQLDGVAKAMAVMERHGGVLVADEVGLGKTYVAGEIIRRIRQAEGQPVLVVCPANIRESVWRVRLDEWQLDGVHVISYHQLVSRVRKLRRTRTRWRAYGLVVLDEAHYLRNPETRYQEALQSLLQQQPRRPRMLLLTATPIHNRGRDLAELLWWAVGAAQDSPVFDGPGSQVWLQRISRLCDDADQLEEGSAGLRELHRELDRVMVRRTRRFIQEHYPPDAEGGLHFPSPEQVEVRYRLPAPLRHLFADVLDAVGHDELPMHMQAELDRLRGDAPPVGRLRLAAYSVSAYALHGGEPPWWLPLFMGMLRTNLLKRLDSSTAALASTAANMAERTRRALDDLDKGLVCVRLGKREQREIRDLLDDPDYVAAGLTGVWSTDFNLLVDQRLGGERLEEHQRPGRQQDARYHRATRYDAVALRKDLEHDLAVLEHLAASARSAASSDPKPGVITDLLAQIAQDPRGPKAVLFSTSRVTTTDLGRRLRTACANRPELAVYRERTVNLGDDEPPTREEIKAALAGFAPDTAAPAPGEIGGPQPEDRFDLLLTTDMLAEGVNLQQAGIIINYDLTWNPQWLAQRFGRVDRLGSPHQTVTAYTVVPDTGLDLVMGLMERLLTKAHIAAACVGTSSSPLFPGAPVSPRHFTDLTEHLDQSPVPAARLPLAEYQRAWLAEALRTPHAKQALDQLPAYWSGAIHPDHFETPGVVYCFEVTHPGEDDRTTAFTRVLGHPRYQAITSDPARCLQEAHIDLVPWLRAARTRPPSPAPQRHVAPSDLALVWELLDYARDEVADAHAIPRICAEDRIRLVAWMLLPHRRK
ncbi:SNF2-related protein [Streptomyces chrestomyceticus]|uniref:SNF2-related protein n=1 Tax=Streptomyces chrestomyceticus TaxID=68185 RepID=UPI0033C4648F